MLTQHEFRNFASITWSCFGLAFHDANFKNRRNKSNDVQEKQNLSHKSPTPYFRDREREQDRIRHLYGSDSKVKAYKTKEQTIRRSQTSRCNGNNTNIARHQPAHHQTKIRHGIANHEHCCHCNANMPPPVIFVPVPHYHWPSFYVPRFQMGMPTSPNRMMGPSNRPRFAANNNRPELKKFYPY
ncbi:uncharacterized protein LOC131994157 [Stomoxys calcitrans]|uniref:uncharacterized protein LOC131994157 n=1 Tax=Stomoxys calcitrans TaxID=35570 RepID=UPI0027E38DA1|nr:uncharacterized protein LOC131994157 [Stomoxys calcitrans]